MIEQNQKKIINQQFYSYVMPSMITMLLSGFYAIVDGLFVGNAVGNHGLAAINLVYPIQVILNASALGIGIGGAVIYSGCLGKEDQKGMTHALASTMTLLVSIGILLPIGLRLALPWLLELLGTTPQLYDHAHSYIVIALLGGILPVLGNGLNPILRNQGNTYLATIFMSCGLITNILLDYVFVFVFAMGLSGAALATILAQGIVAFLSILYLWKHDFHTLQRQDFVPSISLIKKIASIGCSPFGQTLAPSLIIVLTNWMCLRYGGNDAVTIYSVVSYILCSAQLLLQGIGDGIQPLISRNYSAKRFHEVHYLHQKALNLTLIFSLFLLFAIWWMKEPLISLFGVSEALMKPAKTAVIITALSFPFLGLVRLTCAMFYASEKTIYASLLVYLEPCFILPALLMICTLQFRLQGIWIAYPIAQLVMSTLSILLHVYSKRTKQIQYTYEKASESL